MAVRIEWNAQKARKGFVVATLVAFWPIEWGHYCVPE